jgi:serine phosphatase RsbU (regulator of sigma subunit)
MGGEMADYIEHERDFISLVDELELSDHISSLRYAGIIQHALMPDPEVIRKYIRNFFILFLPRDIVSGDFYYVFCNREKICIAAGDCTGHGVPGALMSILGISFLNEIMQSGINLKANRVLNLMREKVMKALNQKGDNTDTKDSIDIALCLIDCASKRIDFSGAGRPLYMVRNGELIEYKADNMTIGIDAVQEKSFTNHSIVTAPGDSFYMFSDGFCDQFGGLSDKKFKYWRFRELIKSVQGLNMTEQKCILERTFEEWKGKTQQIDDVTVFGFQI